MSDSIARTLKYREALDEALVQAMERDESVFCLGVGDPKGIFGTHALRVPEVRLGARLRYAACRERGQRHRDRRCDLRDAPGDGARAERLPPPQHGPARQPRGEVALHVGRRPAGAAHDPGHHRPRLGAGRPALPEPAGPLRPRPRAPRGDAEQRLRRQGPLLSAIADDSPTIILEHRAIFEKAAPVPVEPYEAPVGRETVARAGSDVTVVAVSQMVGEARKAGHTLAAQGIGVEVIDPR